MAYRRSLLRIGNLPDWNFRPSFSYVLHIEDRKRKRRPLETGIPSVIQTRSFGSSLNESTGFVASSQCSGYSFCRSLSTFNQGPDNIDFVAGVTDILAETAVEAAPVVNEVAIAATDSFLPVKVLQYVIDAVHSYTGLNWWSSIVLTTLLVQGATVPLLINQLKASSKFRLMRPQMEEIMTKMEYKAMDRAAIAEGQKQMEKLFKECGMSTFTPLKGLFIQVPIFIGFYLAITNMAEKMPSFKHGGSYWFIDLTTPDALYIFPVLTALSFFIPLESGIQDGSNGTHLNGSGTMRNLSRVFCVLTVPVTMEFPKAIFCFWLTSNVFLITYRLVLRVPGVKKSLGIPEIVVPQSQH